MGGAGDLRDAVEDAGDKGEEQEEEDVRPSRVDEGDDVLRNSDRGVRRRTVRPAGLGGLEIKIFPEILNHMIIKNN